MSVSELSVFRAVLQRRIRWMEYGARIAPDEDWPGMLFVENDKRRGRARRAIRARGLSEQAKHELATVELPARLRARRARRAGWFMPAWRRDFDPPIECVVLVGAEPDDAEAVVAVVSLVCATSTTRCLRSGRGSGPVPPLPRALPAPIAEVLRPVLAPPPPVGPVPPRCTRFGSTA